MIMRWTTTTESNCVILTKPFLAQTNPPFTQVMDFKGWEKFTIAYSLVPKLIRSKRAKEIFMKAGSNLNIMDIAGPSPSTSPLPAPALAAFRIPDHDCRHFRLVIRDQSWDHDVQGPLVPC